MTSEVFTVPWKRSLTAPRLNFFINSHAMKDGRDLQHFSNQERETSRVTECVYAAPDGLSYLVSTSVFSDKPAFSWDSTSITLFHQEILDLDKFYRLDGSYFIDVPHKDKISSYDMESLRVVREDSSPSQIRIERHGPLVGLLKIINAYSTNEHQIMKRVA